MKKHYFFTLLATLLFTTFSFGQSVIITRVIDGKAPDGGCSSGSGSSNPKAVELYVDGMVDFSGYTYEVESNGGATESWSSEDISSLGMRQDEFVYISPGSTATLYDMYSGATSANTFDGGTSFNGNDAIRITDGTNVIDQLGDPSDVTGSSDHDNPWAYQDSYVSRKDGSSANGGTFDVAEWNVPGDNFFDNGSITSCADMLAQVNFGAFSTSVSNDPSISFVAPVNNQVFPAGTENVNIMLNVQNFTLSGDNGSGESDDTGDGYIVGTSTKNGMADGTPVNIFDVDAGEFELEDGSSYTLTAELVDNDGNSFDPKIDVTVAFSVELPCEIQLESVSAVCDAATTGTDTYTATLPFTEGNTHSYTITAKDSNDNDVGTIGGDDPGTNETGNIVVSGVPEGTNFTIRVVGGTGSSCDLTRSVTSPTCYPLPIFETFNDYTVNNNLISNPLWQDASTSNTPNDIQVVANDDGGGNLVLGNFYGSNDIDDPSGNMITLSGGGSDPYIGFETVSSGMVFASFFFHAKDFTGVGDDDGGYFAVLAENGSFRGRLWIRDVTADGAEEGLQYQLGLSTTSGNSSTLHTGFTANILEPVFVVIGYNLDNDNVMLWVVPDATSFGTNTPPAANVTLTDGEAEGINRFLFRQDSSNETPSIDIEDLRIGTTWSDVTSTPTASVGENPIVGFGAFPNPVINKQLTITSQSADAKQVVLYNILGKQVFSQNISGTRDTVELDALRSGLYILKVIEGSKISTSKLVIK